MKQQGHEVFTVRAGKRRKSKGQALVEYALTLLVVIGLVAIVDHQLRKGLGGLWKTMAREVAAGCPKCDPPESMQ